MPTAQPYSINSCLPRKRINGSTHQCPSASSAHRPLPVDPSCEVLWRRGIRRCGTQPLSRYADAANPWIAGDHICEPDRAWQISWRGVRKRTRPSHQAGPAPRRRQINLRLRPRRARSRLYRHLMQPSRRRPSCRRLDSYFHVEPSTRLEPNYSPQI